MVRQRYVYAIVEYVGVEDDTYSIIYIAPENYWNEVGALQSYKEANEGELKSYIDSTCGEELSFWDIVHWYYKGDGDEETLVDLLESAKFVHSETLKEYAENHVQEFGDQYISELYS